MRSQHLTSKSSATADGSDHGFTLNHPLSTFSTRRLLRPHGFDGVIGSSGNKASSPGDFVAPGLGKNTYPVIRP